jgi:hypothetical protein
MNIPDTKDVLDHLPKISEQGLNIQTRQNMIVTPLSSHRSSKRFRSRTHRRFKPSLKSYSIRPIPYPSSHLRPKWDSSTAHHPSYPPQDSHFSFNPRFKRVLIKSQRLSLPDLRKDENKKIREQLLGKKEETLGNKVSLINRVSLLPPKSLVKPPPPEPSPPVFSTLNIKYPCLSHLISMTLSTNLEYSERNIKALKDMGKLEMWRGLLEHLTALDLVQLKVTKVQEWVEGMHRDYRSARQRTIHKYLGS